MSDMNSFTSDEEFVKRHETFRKKSQSLIRNNELLRQHLPEVIQSILQRKHLQNSLNILSVGSCDGKSDFEILKIVKEELEKKPDSSQVKIFNRAVEPNGCSLKMYKAAFDEIPNLSGDEKITLQLCEKTFENYKDEADREQVKFDIIHFVHCLYYIDIETALIHCMEKELAEDGCIVCIVGGKDFFDRSDQNSLTLFGEILKVVKEQGWKYQAVAQEFLIDITDIFEEESEEGNLFLDFLMQVKKFRVKTSVTEVKRALETYKEAAIEEQGKLFLKRINDLIIIRCK